MWISPAPSRRYRPGRRGSRSRHRARDRLRLRLRRRWPGGRRPCPPGKRCQTLVSRRDGQEIARRQASGKLGIADLAEQLDALKPSTSRQSSDECGWHRPDPIGRRRSPSASRTPAGLPTTPPARYAAPYAVSGYRRKRSEGVRPGGLEPRWLRRTALVRGDLQPVAPRQTGGHPLPAPGPQSAWRGCCRSNRRRRADTASPRDGKGSWKDGATVRSSEGDGRSRGSAGPPGAVCAG